MNRADRIAGTDRHIRRQLAIGKATRWASRRMAEPHRLAKLSIATCGNPRCMFCMNPRKRGELTMQEKRLMQRMRDGYDGF